MAGVFAKRYVFPECYLCDMHNCEYFNDDYGRNAIGGGLLRYFLKFLCLSFLCCLLLAGWTSGVKGQPVAKPLEIVKQGNHHLLVDHGNNTLRVWDLEQQKLVWSAEDLATNLVTVDPKGKYIASLRGKKDLVGYDTASGNILWHIEAAAQNKKLSQLQLSSQGRYIIGQYNPVSLKVTPDLLYKVWDSSTGKEVIALQDLMDLQVSRNERFIAVAHRVKNVEYIPLVHGQGAVKVTNETKTPNKFKGLFADSSADSIEIWSLGTGRKITGLSGHGSEIDQLIIGPNSHYVVGFTRLPGSFSIWDSSTGKKITTVQIGSNLTGNLGGRLFSIDHSGTYLSYIAMNSSKARVWRLADGNEYQFVKSSSAGTPLHYIEATKEPEKIVAVGHGEVSTWDMETSSRTSLFQQPYTMGKILLTDEFQSALSCYLHGVAKHDLKTGRQLYTLLGHSKPPVTFTVWQKHPTAPALLTKDQTGRLNLWDLQTGTLLACNALNLHGRQKMPEITMAGNFIVAHNDSQNLIWNIATDTSYQIAAVNGNWTMTEIDKERSKRHNQLVALTKNNIPTTNTKTIAPQQLLTWLSEESNSAERILIVQTLAGMMNNNRDIALIEQLIKQNSHQPQCAELLLLLGEVGTPASASFITPFLRQRDQKISLAAEEALRKIYSNDHIEFLIVMAQHGNTRWQEKAIKELGRSGSDKALGFLIEGLTVDPTPGQINNSHISRKKMAVSLGKIQNERAFNALLKAAASGQRQLQEAAIAGLGASNNPRAYDEIMAILVATKGPSISWQTFLATNQYNRISLLRQTIEAFGDLQSNRATPFLKKMLMLKGKGASFKGMKRDCLTALGKIGSKEAAELLVTEMAESKSWLTKEHKVALLAAKDNINPETLITIINTGSTWSQRHALEVLAEVSPAKVGAIYSGPQ